MISFKLYCKSKFDIKKSIKDILEEFLHEHYYIDVNSSWDGNDAIYVKWFEERAPIQIFEFRDKFEESYGDKYILETNSTINDIHFYIVKRDN